MNNYIMAIPIQAYIKLIRPKQWVKNTFVFIPLLFRGLAFDVISFFNSFTAFILFCVAASAVYILNDIYDIEYDSKHPIKSKERPLANGELTIKQAIYLLVGLYGIIILQIWLFPELFNILLIYIILNFAYTFLLKQQPVIDIFIISLGFVLRIVAGAVAIAVQTSSWMLITTLCLALYMTAIKRRQEILIYHSYNKNLLGKNEKNKTRDVLDKYNRSLLNRYAEISGVSAFMFYSLYVFTKEPDLFITIPLVIFGLFRYWYVVEHQYGGESPTDLLLADKQLLTTIILWVIICAWVKF